MIHIRTWVIIMLSDRCHIVYNSMYMYYGFIENGYIHRSRKQIDRARELRGNEIRKTLLNKRFLLWSGRNVWE